MRRWSALGAVALFVALAVGGAALGGGLSQDDPLGKRTVVAFLDVAAEESFLDVDPPATDPNALPSPGDTFFFRNELRNLADTETRGRFDGKCVFLLGGMADCRGHVALAGGKIELGGGIDFSTGPTVFRSAVLGGTGRYRNVVGEATITQIAEGRSKLVLELVPSHKRA